VAKDTVMANKDLISIIFWAVSAAYVIHILDETLMGGGFTQKVKERWWPIMPLIGRRRRFDESRRRMPG